MLSLILVMVISVSFAYCSERTSGTSLGGRPIRWDVFLVLATAIMTLFSGLRTEYNDSPLSSKKQKNNCRQRYPGFGCPFFYSFQGSCLLAAA